MGALSGLGFQDCSIAVVGGNIVLAIVHSIFCYYLFVQLNKAAGDGAPGRVVLSQLWKIGLYDIGVCLYILAYFGSLGWCLFAASSLDGCDDSFGAAGGALLMLAYQTFGVGAYIFYFFCFQTCCSPTGSAPHGAPP